MVTMDAIPLRYLGGVLLLVVGLLLVTVTVMVTIFLWYPGYVRTVPL